MDGRSVPWWVKKGVPNPAKGKEAREKMADAKRGSIPWNKGLPPEMQSRYGTGNVFVCKVCRGSFKAPPHKKRVYCSNACQGEDYKIRFKGRSVTWGDKISEYQKKNSPFFELNKDPEFQKKRIRALNQKPTKPELRVMNVIEENNLPFRYVGNGDVIIGTLNPDFIHLKDNKIIEVFGRVFHDPLVSPWEIPIKRQYEGRINYYEGLGYSCLILYDDEVNNSDYVLERIRSGF